MKKIATSILLLILSLAVFGQPAKTSLTRDEYLKKSKSQKVVAFVLVGIGAVALVAVSGGNTDLDALGPIVVISAAAILGSIPLFIASGKNKRRARNAAVSFNFQRTQTMQGDLVNFHAVPSLSLKIHL